MDIVNSDYQKLPMHLPHLIIYTVLSQYCFFTCSSQSTLALLSGDSPSLKKMAGSPVDPMKYYNLQVTDEVPPRMNRWPTLYGWPTTGGVWTLSPTQEQLDAFNALGTTEDMDEHCRMLQQVGATFHPDADEYLQREREEQEATREERPEEDPAELAQWAATKQHVCPGGSAVDITKHIAAHIGGKACPHCGIAFEEQVAAGVRYCDVI